jgi:lysophospholipase L1-like esterase
MASNARKKRKKINSNKLISTVIPLIILIVLGSIIGNKVSNSKDVINNNVYENVEKNEIFVNDSLSTTNNIEKEENSIKSSEIKDLNNVNMNKDKKDVKFDDKVAFIGDSRTQGLIMYTGLTKINDYSYIGLMVDTAIKKEFVKTSDGKKVTLLEDMKNKDIDTVYIMLGVNELGWAYPEVFKLKYKELIEKIREIKPNVNIYVQSIIPVTKEIDSTNKYINNNRIRKYNDLIKELANELDVKYLDVASALVNDEGYLPSQASTDGIHVDRDYCLKWLEYLKNNS